MACTLPPIGLILLLIVGFVCPSNIPLTAIAGIIVKTGTGLELGCATVFLADVVAGGRILKIFSLLFRPHFFMSIYIIN